MSQNSRETRVDVQLSDIQFTNKNNRSILNDLAKYDQFSDDIKIRANAIYLKMNPTTNRAKKRTFLLFYCIYNAYKELNIDIDPSELGDIFGLTSGELQKTSSMFSRLQTNYKPINKPRTISNYINDYCNNIGLKDYVDDIIQLSDSILEKNIDLNQSATQPVAAGMIKYYMTSNGIELSNKEFLAKVAKRSDTTIEAMYKKISAADNA